MHLGRIFLPPTTEHEYFIKHDLKLPDTVEVNRIEVFMSGYSHHFIIYKLSPAVAGNFPNGLRLMNPVNGSGSSTGVSTLVGAWQFSYNLELPTATAFRWEYGSVLDLNYHLKNYNIDSVLATDIYFNVYTQPKGTAADIMYSDLLFNLNIPIPPNNQNTTFTKHDFFSGATNWWNIWLLASHTHKLGIDYDIFLRNPNGTLGQQIYEGFFDPTYTFNQGYYDWQHPPVRRFDPPQPLNPQHGLVQQATYRNPGPNWVSWGFTTDDEMMLYFIQYTIGSPLTSVNSPLVEDLKLCVYPNPFRDKVYITLELDKTSGLKLEVFDILGNKVTTLADGRHETGPLNFMFDAKAKGTSPGFYIMKIEVNGQSSFVKLTLTD